MAMSKKPKTPPSSRTKPSVRPVYENFEPKSEMKENEGAYSLHIYLPGAYVFYPFFVVVNLPLANGYIYA